MFLQLIGVTLALREAQCDYGNVRSLIMPWISSHLNSIRLILFCLLLCENGGESRPGAIICHRCPSTDTLMPGSHYIHSRNRGWTYSSCPHNVWEKPQSRGPIICLQNHICWCIFITLYQITCLVCEYPNFLGLSLCITLNKYIRNMPNFCELYLPNGKLSLPIKRLCRADLSRIAYSCEPKYSE